MSGSSSSPNLGVVCDNEVEADLKYSYDDLEVIIDKSLLEYCETISVDFVKTDTGGCSADGGFKITPKVSL